MHRSLNQLIVYAIAVDTFNVDQNLRINFYLPGQFAKSLARFGNFGHHAHSSEHAVAGGSEVAEDHVTTLFATERVAIGTNLFEHVTIANIGFQHGDAGLFHGNLQPEVAHYGGHQSIACEFTASFHAERQNRHDLVAVDDGSGVVNHEAAVGIAVVSNAGIGLVLEHGGLKSTEMG